MKRIYILIFLCVPMAVWSQVKVNQDKIQKIINGTIDNKKVFGIALSIADSDSIYDFASGNIYPNDQYFLASVTKLYTTSIIFQLIETGQINAEDPIKMYLSDDLMEGLHIYNGIDYSDSIRIKHLISNTSGLPDYFEENNSSGRSIREYLLSVGDTILTFDEIIEITKNLSPQFVPGEDNKAHYSDGNFQLLGKIIESITNNSLQNAYSDFIFSKLTLKSTYLYSDPKDTLPKRFYYQDKIIHIPKMMSSFKSDGGIVSTSRENIIFLKAFFEGQLFSENFIKIDGTWNKIYSPFEYGEGLMKFKFIGIPEMVGHAGASGSFSYYVPDKGVYLTGTINQIDKPQIAYKLIAKILNTIE